MTLPHPADGRSFTITAAPPADLAALGGD